MTEEEWERVAREFWDQLALMTEHRNITYAQAFREMCESAIKACDGTEEQRVADGAREFLRLLDAREALSDS
jgi:hypothetical protein